MAEVIWSPEAVRDLEDIASFIAKDSEHNAAIFVQRLIDATELPTVFPRAGRVVPEVGDSRFREIIEGDYRIMYTIEGRNVHVHAVLHGARRVKRSRWRV